MNCLICDQNLKDTWCEYCMADSYVSNNEFFLAVRLIANNLKAFEVYFEKFGAYYSCIFNLTNKTCIINFVSINTNDHLYTFRKDYYKIFSSKIKIKPINLVDFIKKIIKKQYLL